MAHPLKVSGDRRPLERRKPESTLRKGGSNLGQRFKGVGRKEF